MLKDDIAETVKELEAEAQRKDNNMDDMNMQFKGELEIWGLDKDGKIYHHDKQHNVVTNWAKHATMHLMTGEVYTTHGDRVVNGFGARSRRSPVSLDHSNTANVDGTLISNEQYLGDNSSYEKYWSLPNTAEYPPSAGLDDNIVDGYVYPFFPTKMLFGTGIEYRSWQDVSDDERAGSDQGGYGNASNGSWDQPTFEEFIITNPNDENFYSNYWDGAAFELSKTRTVNDVYSAALSDEDNPVDEDSFGVKGAIKNATYNGTNGITVLTGSAPFFATGSYRGIGQPSFIYARRDLRFMQDSEAKLEMGLIAGTEHLESKITFTVIMPKQEAGEFYPYNGYTLKVAGLFADSAMLLRNTVPADNGDNDDTTTQLEYSSYQKMPGGLMWATRNIAPIFKSHDSTIIAQWSVYL
ncbi:MAG: hypothetical protein DRJ01_02235 [Bacteroidetes bacterium]|nr:MAG: hypothetical protein DRJ01_02235 [Bacteroidota bacterium]